MSSLVSVWGIPDRSLGPTMSEIDDVVVRAQLHAHGLHEAAEIRLEFDAAFARLRAAMALTREQLEDFAQRIEETDAP